MKFLLLTLFLFSFILQGQSQVKFVSSDGKNVYTLSGAGMSVSGTSIVFPGSPWSTGNGFIYYSYNVGIGTATPTVPLDVLGSIRFRSGAAAGRVLTSDATGNATWQYLPLQTTYPTTSEPTDPSSGFSIVWFDGTNLKAKKNVGGTITTITIF